MKEETIIKADIHAVRSIADIILSERMHPLKRWALKKLIPAHLWDLPPQTLAKLQKGAVIGSIAMHAAMPSSDCGISVRSR